jgi:hypothetical protein
MRSWCRMRATAVLLMRNEWGVVAKSVAARDRRASTSFDRCAGLHRAMRRVVLGSSDAQARRRHVQDALLYISQLSEKRIEKVSSKFLLVAIEFWFKHIILVLAKVH